RDRPLIGTRIISPARPSGSCYPLGSSQEGSGGRRAAFLLHLDQRARTSGVSGRIGCRLGEGIDTARAGGVAFGAQQQVEGSELVTAVRTRPRTGSWSAGWPSKSGRKGRRATRSDWSGFEREAKAVRRALEGASAHPVGPKEYDSACRSGGLSFDVTIEPGFTPGRGRPGARLQTRDLKETRRCESWCW